MNLKKWNGNHWNLKNWMSLMVVTTVVYSAVAVNTAYAQVRKPPTPGQSNERRIDLDANIIQEFNLLNDALEAGVQRGLSIDAKYQLIESLKQANALLGIAGGGVPAPMPPTPMPIPGPMPAQIMIGERVILDPQRLPNHWYGLDVLTVQAVDHRYGEVQVYNPTKNASGRFRISDILRSVSSYGGMQVGQSVMVTDPNHWWNRNRAEAYIDLIFANGTFKLKCPRLNAEGVFSFGQFMRI